MHTAALRSTLPHRTPTHVARPAELAAALRIVAVVSVALCRDPANVSRAAAAIGSVAACLLAALVAIRWGAAVLDAIGPALALPLACVLGAVLVRVGEALGRGLATTIGLAFHSTRTR